VAVAPPAATMDDFAWRVSIATITGDSVFSEFAGIDRYLVPLSSAGLDLTIDDRAQRVAQYEVCAFAGESLVSSTGGSGTSDDLNLMLRRTSATGSLRIERLSGPIVVAPSRGESILVVVLEGEVGIVGDASVRTLGIRDAVLVRSGRPWTLSGDAVVALAAIRVKNSPSVPMP